MRWLKGEPKLRDVLADPVIQLMMRRDQVDPEHLHAFLLRVSGRLGGVTEESPARLVLAGQSPTRTH
jgi:hypothetical protein